MVYYRIYSHEDAKDITQEVVMQIIKNIKHLQKTDSIHSWCYNITMNKIRDHKRKEKSYSFLNISSITDTLYSNIKKTLNYSDKTQEQEITPSSNYLSNDLEDSLKDKKDPFYRMQQKEFWSILKEFTDSLSKKEKEVFTLRFVEQFSIKEISNYLNKNESTIKTHLYRALNKFSIFSKEKDLKDLFHKLQYNN